MYKIIMVALLLSISATAHAKIQTKEIVYKVNQTELTGYLAFDDTISGKRPGILVVHEWWGHNDYARKRAEMLAALGYTAFAIDMYGTGKLASHPDDAKKFMMAVMSDQANMKQRFLAGLDVLLAQATVDTTKTAAIGYCMGGGIALNMARAGVDLDGVVVFHGGLGTETPVKKGQIKAKIRVFTGGADAFVPQKQVQAFEQEMKAADVDYKLKIYPGVTHSFTSPAADDFAKKYKLPFAYSPTADQDSWQQMQVFFNKLFK